jgi:hypothetical protein
LAALLLIFLLMAAPLVSADPAGGTTDLSETIQYLLDFVKNSGCRFYRNDKAHTAAKAAAHMQRKYEHFKDEIKTPEDFIRLTATRSLLTGKLYHVELGHGKNITSETWLRQALENYRQKQN